MYTMHKYFFYEVRMLKRIPRRPFNVRGSFIVWQADIAHMIPGKNGETLFLLVVDVFSRYTTCLN